MKKLLLIPLCLALCSCSLLKSERVHIAPAEPRLDADQTEIMQEQAKINNDLARWIRANGVKPNDEKVVQLEDGTKVFVKFFGSPIEDVDGTNAKQAHHVTDKANGVAEDYRRDTAEWKDDVHEDREKSINKANSKWDIWKILGFFTSTWFLVAVGLVVAAFFFPVLWPIVQIFWQISKMGLGAFKVVASLGLHGVLNILKAVETFRENHKNTIIGEAFNTHMNASLDPKTKASLDAFKNHFDV